MDEDVAREIATLIEKQLLLYGSDIRLYSDPMWEGNPYGESMLGLVKQRHSFWLTAQEQFHHLAEKEH